MGGHKLCTRHLWLNTLGPQQFCQWTCWDFLSAQCMMGLFVGSRLHPSAIMQDVLFPQFLINQVNNYSKLTSVCMQATFESYEALPTAIAQRLSSRKKQLLQLLVMRPCTRWGQVKKWSFRFLFDCFLTHWLFDSMDPLFIGKAWASTICIHYAKCHVGNCQTQSGCQKLLFVRRSKNYNN